MKKGKKMDAEKEKVIEAEVVKEEKSNLPAKSILGIVQMRSITERIDVINNYHNAAMSCMAQGAAYALLCGFELHAARATVGEGGWIKWIESNCEFHRMSAWRYMEAAERKAGEIADVTRVLHDKLLARSGLEMSSDERKQLIGVVTDKYADKTARQLWFELGVLKTQLPKKNLPLKTPTDLPPGVTKEEFDKARRACRLQEWITLLNNSKKLCCDHPTFQDIPLDTVTDAYMQFQKCARVLKVFLDKTGE